MSDDQGNNVPVSGMKKKRKSIKVIKMEYKRLLRHIAIMEDMLVLTHDEELCWYTYIDDRQLLENRQRNPFLAGKGESYQAYMKMSRFCLKKRLKEAKKKRNRR